MTEKPTWTILLIDAQPMSRNTLKSQLEYYQYAVLPADSARSSVQTFQQHQRAIDLVVLNLDLKNAPGTKVLGILRKLAPELKIIAITDQGVADGRDEFEGLAGVLRKPVRTDRLLAVVGRALGRT
jgi:DNA-binding NtrC family response regulator